MTGETDPYNREFVDPRDFEHVRPKEGYSVAEVLMTREDRIEIQTDLLQLTTTGELRSASDAAVWYGAVGPRIDGFRVESHQGEVQSAIIADSLDVIGSYARKHGKLVLGTNVDVMAIDLSTERAEGLQRLAQENNCLMGELLTVGFRLRKQVRDAYREGNRVLAIIPDATPVVIAPIS